MRSSKEFSIIYYRTKWQILWILLNWKKKDLQANWRRKWGEEGRTWEIEWGQEGNGNGIWNEISDMKDEEKQTIDYQHRLEELV